MIEHLQRIERRHIALFWDVLMFISILIIVTIVENLLTILLLAVLVVVIMELLQWWDKRRLRKYYDELRGIKERPKHIVGKSGIPDRYGFMPSSASSNASSYTG